MSSTRDHIVNLTSAALSPSPDISGCPTTVAMLAAPTVLRATAEGISSPSAYRALRTLADQIDDLAGHGTPKTLCRKCGVELTPCETCGKPGQCGEARCDACAPDAGWMTTGS